MAGVPGRATKQQLDVLNIVSASARKGVLDELRGMWCDALLPLVHMEWPKARQVEWRNQLHAWGTETVIVVSYNLQSFLCQLVF